jgi:hypothetical protein
LLLCVTDLLCIVRLFVKWRHWPQEHFLINLKNIFLINLIFKWRLDFWLDNLVRQLDFKAAWHCNSCFNLSLRTAGPEPSSWVNRYVGWLFVGNVSKSSFIMTGFRLEGLHFRHVCKLPART